jgi:septal ring factor EnvC (AmiA/AmiB activator)
MLVLATLLCSLVYPAYGARSSDDEARLQKLRGRIVTLQEKMNETRGRRDTVRDEKRDLERRIGSLLNELKQTEALLHQNEKKLENLKSRAAREAGNLVAQQKQLERQIYMAFMAGHQDYPKTLLSQDNPASVARVLTYYRYLNRERTERIAAIGDTISQLDVTKTQIHSQSRELEILRNTQHEQKTALENSHTRRNELLASLNRQVRDQAQEIERLRADEKRMEQLVEELKIVLPEIPLPSSSERHFSRLRGRLPLPTRGQVLARYGTQKNIGNLKWRGLLIGGREGQQVISVFHGRVVYADWLRGFGLLLILEHGDGYMTLYGHNQSLHKTVGDWVKAGEVIASLGNTGDAAQPGLYFEIRHNGEPRDPLIWCRAR